MNYKIRRTIIMTSANMASETPNMIPGSPSVSAVHNVRAFIRLPLMTVAIWILWWIGADLARQPRKGPFSFAWAAYGVAKKKIVLVSPL
ncbi:hypothetical protein [Amycolatopsis sp. NPDC051061]|uniref:hypothetical protein n=1 Tax=Amycolatopsis sp. NPDC051061 TaxID=3155042 RepID=UPI003415D730